MENRSVHLMSLDEFTKILGLGPVQATFLVESGLPIIHVGEKILVEAGTAVAWIFFQTQWRSGGWYEAVVKPEEQATPTEITPSSPTPDLVAQTNPNQQVIKFPRQETRWWDSEHGAKLMGILSKKFPEGVIWSDGRAELYFKKWRDNPSDTMYTFTSEDHLDRFVQSLPLTKN